MNPIELDPHRVAVLGAGRLGRATARLLTKATLALYDRAPAVLDDAKRETGLDIEATTDLATAIRGAQLLVLAVPAHEQKALAETLGPHVLPDQMALLASRGVTEGFTLPHTHLRTHTCLRKIGVLGGPLHVRELAAGRRMNAVIASKFSEVVKAVQGFVADTPISLQPSKDIVGVQVAGAVANVASIAAGMAEGLELGDTARGVLLARGLLEGRAIAETLDADPETFSGLAGIGELIPRAVRSMERHLELGRALGSGQKLDAALAMVEGHVEGLSTADEAAALAERTGLFLPMVQAVHEVAAGRGQARARLEAVLAHPLAVGG